MRKSYIVAFVFVVMIVAHKCIADMCSPIAVKVESDNMRIGIDQSGLDYDNKKLSYLQFHITSDMAVKQADIQTRQADLATQQDLYNQCVVNMQANGV